VRVLSAPFMARDRKTAIVEFPGGYIAEIHSVIAATTRDRDPN